MKTLTNTQQRYLEAAVELTTELSRPPRLTEVRARAGVYSDACGHEQRTVARLVELGYLAQRHGHGAPLVPRKTADGNTLKLVLVEVGP